MNLSDMMREAGEASEEFFYHFEPWDPGERPAWVVDLAKKDEVNLSREPSLFQTGYLFSEAKTCASQAANRVGKSIAALIETIIMATGELPYSLRHPKGFDTGIKRYIGDHDERRENNILRFGRYSIETGELIDHCPWTKKRSTD